MNKRLVGVLLKSLNKTMFLFGIVLSALGGGMGLFLPQFIGRLLDQTYLSNLLTRPELLAGFILFFVSVYTVQALSNYFIGRSGSKALKQLQQYIYESLLTTSVKDLDQYQSGDLASRLTNDMSVVHHRYSSKFLDEWFDGYGVNLFSVDHQSVAHGS